VESKVQNGYLLLADLSGYTKFMATSELEHAREILPELINLVIKNLKPVFNIAEVEGDAVFAYVSEDKFLRSETLLEIIESTYYSFTFHKNVMLDRTTCTCRACNSIDTLDLKFINHFGSFALQNYSGIVKPLGSDVNLIHLLLKNSVIQNTNVASYSLFTNQCYDKLEMPEDLFIPNTEGYEHFGEIKTYVLNLSDSYKRLAESKRFSIKEESADYVAEYQFEMPPVVLWEWLIDPNKRNLWMEGTVWTKGERPHGRTTQGATNHCAHGKESSLELILDWKPFEYYTYESGNKLIQLISTIKLIQNENGTMLHEIIKLKNKLPGFLSKMITKLIALKVMKVYEGYRRIADLQKEYILTSNRQK